MGLGDEGFFNDPGNPSYPYQYVLRRTLVILHDLIQFPCRGSEGIDFDANLNITTLDFATAHVSLPAPLSLFDSFETHPNSPQLYPVSHHWRNRPRNMY